MTKYPKLIFPFDFRGFRQCISPKALVPVALLLFSFSAIAQITVWPGDANNDGIVNHLDILNIGRGFGRQGNPRDSVNTTWQQEQVQQWNDTLPNAQNLGYADCSGNGFVNIEDVLVIESNYDSMNVNFTGIVYLQGGPNDPALTVIANGGAFLQGEQGFVTIYLDEQATDSVYSVAFTFEYDTTIIDETTVFAQPHPQYGGGGRPPVSVQKNFENPRYLEFGISRTNGRNHGGSIAVCNIHFLIEDNLLGKDFVDFLNAFKVTKIRLFDRLMNSIAVRGDTSDATIMTGVHEEQALPFNIYPVPASDWVFIDNYNNEKLVSVELIDLKGILYAPVQLQRDWSTMLDVSALPTGIYVVRVITERGVLHQKMMVQR